MFSKLIPNEIFPGHMSNKPVLLSIRNSRSLLSTVFAFIFYSLAALFLLQSAQLIHYFYVLFVTLSFNDGSFNKYFIFAAFKYQSTCQNVYFANGSAEFSLSKMFHSLLNIMLLESLATISNFKLCANNENTEKKLQILICFNCECTAERINLGHLTVWMCF